MESTTSCTKDRSEVVVIITAHRPSPNFVCPERCITLTEQNPKITIGRASKVASKGFVASKENTWFDSPVMSRDHAELVANFDTKAVYIKDTGSTHGTFHKSQDTLGKEIRVSSREQTKLANGDQLRFGIDIYRPQETFPPCRVGVKMLWGSPEIIHAQPDAASRAASTNRFVVPDDEEDEDFMSDDDSIQEMPTPAAGGQTDSLAVSRPIDLTGDSPSTTPAFRRTTLAASTMILGNSDLNVVDLTSEAEIHPYSSEDDDSDSHDDFDDDYPPSPSDISDRDDESPLSPSPFFGESNHDVDSIMEEKSDALVEDSCDCASDAESSIAGVESKWGDDFDKSADTEECEEDDNEDGLRGINYLEDITSDSGRIGEDFSLFDQQASSPTTDITSPIINNAETKLPMSSPGHIFVPEMSQPSTSIISNAISPVQPSFVSSRDRHPSPSDAAMVKQAPIWHPSSAKLTTAQALGERTGKYEFFAARDHNRAAAIGNPFAGTSGANVAPDYSVDSQAKGNEVQYVSPQTHFQSSQDYTAAELATHNPWAEPVSVDDIMMDEGLEQDNPATAPYLVNSLWTPSGEAFLKVPPTSVHESERTRLQSPEFDMTSAASYAESKSRSYSKSGSGVRRLPIQDLLAQDSKEASPSPIPAKSTNAAPKKDEVSGSVEPSSVAAPTPSPVRQLKRSFDEISDEDIDQMVLKESNQNEGLFINVEDAPSAGISTKKDEAAHLDVPVASLPQSISTEPVRDEVRPAKKRRFAQVAACAFGTFIGGAAVLAGMIATAPQI